MEEIEKENKKMRSNTWNRILALMLISALLGALLAGCGKKEEPITTVYAASDFQPYQSSKDDPGKGQLYMQTILQAMKKDGYNIKSALLCGDYSKNGNTWKNIDSQLNNAGVSAVAQILEAELGLTFDDTIYVQGNHDPADITGLDPFGANDAENYGVFVIHEDNYQWKQGVTNSTGNEGTDAKAYAQETAADLEQYLSAKLQEKYQKPIFICAHIPLHYSLRTATMASQDNIYAKMIFDVLNKYGQQLNLIFLYGHNHSDSDDDYLGGGSVYLAEGDKILIANEGDYRSFAEYTLNFTYMNAGYLGYYDGSCAGSGISSTVFAIYGDRVEVARYTYMEKNGKVTAKQAPLKEAGVWDGAVGVGAFQEGVENTTVYSGVQVIQLKKLGEEQYHEE